MNRPLYRHYFQDTQGAIFMVDSADHERLPKLIRECTLIINELGRPADKGRCVPFLMYVPQFLPPPSAHFALIDLPTNKTFHML